MLFRFRVSLRPFYCFGLKNCLLCVFLSKLRCCLVFKVLRHYYVTTEKEGFEPSRRSSRPAPFPGVSLQPSWVLLQASELCSIHFFKLSTCVLNESQRRGWDSNPCGVAAKRFSRPPRYDRFDTSPKHCHSIIAPAL